MRSHQKKLIRDSLLFVVSFCIALLLLRIGIVETVVKETGTIGILGSFIAGIFFTSVFTIAPASVVLAQLSLHNPILSVALLGGLGALLGDLLIFSFMKHGICDDIMYLVSHTRHGRYKKIVHTKLFHFLTPILGAFIIASPLPDELGLALMGVSKTRPSLLVPLSFVFNFIGILIVAFASLHLL